MEDVIIVCEWNADLFHQQVTHWESLGYTALRETYEILAEADPETGLISHQHRIMMERRGDSEVVEGQQREGA